jgi:fibronectin-binding autotransporter adhesin
MVPGQIIKQNSANLILNGANTYSGGTTINTDNGAGAVVAGSPTALGTGNVAISSSATLNLNGQNLTIGALNDGSGSGTVTNGSASGVTFSIGGNGASGSFSGTIQNGSGLVSIAKIGSGIQALSGNNSFTGSVAIKNGTLKIAGSSSIPNPVVLTLGDGVSNTSGALDLFTAGSLTASSLSTAGTGTSNIIASSSNSATLTYSGGTSSFGGKIQDNFGRAHKPSP